MTRDLSLRGILSDWVREVVGIEGRLPRTLGKLFAHPGFLTFLSLIIPAIASGRRRVGA